MPERQSLKMKKYLLIPFLPALFSCTDISMNVNASPTGDDTITPRNHKIDINQRELLFHPLINSSLVPAWPASTPMRTKQLLNNRFITASVFYPLRSLNIVSPALGIIKNTGNDSTGKYCTLHAFIIENARTVEIDFYIGGLDTVFVKAHDTVQLAQTLGTYKPHEVKPLVCGVMNSSSTPLPMYKSYSGFTDFISNHAHMIVPALQKKILIAVKCEYKMYMYEYGKPTDTIEIALGQDPVGHKQRTGDNRTPEGEYRISEKAKGPFYSDTGPYLGNSWMELSYPNRYDAWQGLQQGIITQTQCRAIVQLDLQKKRTPYNTTLGGRVGLHGWLGEWHPDYRDITWGCISLQNEDIDRVFTSLPLNMYVFILP
jgi:hypothetical protein